MILDKKYITKIAGSIFAGRRHRFDHVIMHPTRDWFFALSFFVAIVVVGSAWSGYTYVFYRNEVGAVETKTEELVVYREGLVNLALDTISARAEEYAKIYDELSRVPSELATTVATSTAVDDSIITQSEPEPEVSPGADIPPEASAIQSPVADEDAGTPLIAD